MVIETDLGAQEQVGLVALAPVRPAAFGWAHAYPQFPYVVAILAETHIQPFDLNAPRGRRPTDPGLAERARRCIRGGTEAHVRHTDACEVQMSGNRLSGARGS
jgi:hypothetical protein